MIRSSRFTFVGAAMLVVAAGSFAFAQSTTTQKKDTKHMTTAAQHEMGGQDMQLPPGMTAEDMMKCQAAGTPGDMQAMLTRDAGTWHGKSKMWMTPEAEAINSECTATVTPMYDGRYVKVEIEVPCPAWGRSTAWASMAMTMYHRNSRARGLTQ